ncbi:ABC transporter substrate-binding protein [Kineococcus aurantiacus]|uniref:Multiple sugar transport system substrate-binding protein n=1 Tax=Kineococcus aurantiacus TaxID=37633 RepID=A0A7Y9ATK5_9ACTN|nr:ABC transporter substrate-binding protein [Kineococcus aurantiacus]NYD21306.1 multiple sugar transport system substrate-binding protein [Kineococcus aurantiacus]
MNRPATESEYLASLVPASAGRSGFSRRSMLRGSLLAAGLPALLAACGDGGSGGSGGGGGGSQVTLGSNFSDEVPLKTMNAMVEDAQKKQGISIKLNTVDHTTFQNNINNYLQGSPDDVFSWFAGYRMQFFAAKGLASDISDIWGTIGADYTDAFKKASTGEDGKQYFVPTTYGPWAVFYRKSLWQERGYQAPQTLDEMKTLAAQMQKDGLVPLAFADKEGWPAMGTFDQLNMRINGYQFHVDLMAGEEAWTDQKVKTVFDTWKGLLPLHQTDSLGRTWQEAASGIVNKTSGMMVIGSFIGQQFDEADQEDIDFFNFPEVDPAVGADAVEAPIDGFMMSKRPRNEDGAKKLLEYFGSPDDGVVQTTNDPSGIAANTKSDQSHYTELQKKCAEFVANAKSISQFMDRDTRPDFASTVMIPSLQTFISNPNDIDGLCSQIESQKKSIFAS